MTIKIPGRGGAGGSLAMISDAAASSQYNSPECLPVHDVVPMPLSFAGSDAGSALLAMLAFSSLSLVIVAVEGDREKVLARGPRCVSLSSVVEVLSAYIQVPSRTMKSCGTLRPTFQLSTCFKIRRRKRIDLRSRHGQEIEWYVLFVILQDILVLWKIW